jgi:transcriptional regulator
LEVSVADKPSSASRIELLQGTLDLLVLQTLRWGPRHGYGIAQMIRSGSRDVLQVDTGSLYPALHRLENKGLLAAEWKESETGREAKFYRLTAKGRRQLKSETEDWHRLSAAVGLILRITEGESS